MFLSIIARVYLGSHLIVFPFAERLFPSKPFVSFIGFEFRDGKVHHQSSTLLLPEIVDGFDVRTSGSVSVKDELDLVIVSRFPVALLGDGELAELVSKTPIDISITGTIEEPGRKGSGN